MKKLILGLTLALGSTIIDAQQLSEVEITAHKAAGDVYMLTGAGGNIGVLATEKGLLLVDDQFQPLAEKIESAMQSIKNNQLRYVVNTHYHGDHTGSNSYFSHKAPIFAHENVRHRLTDKENHDVNSLPVVTYKDGLNIYLANENIQLTHLPSGHTDGDTIVYFKEANVIHTGDLFFEIGFPYIDLDSGGSVKGYLANVKKIIEQLPDDVVVIPGHGKLTNKAEFNAFAQMIDFSIKRVEKALSEGKSEEDILQMGIGEKYKSKSWSFISEEKWLKTLVKDLK
ncbi:MULTISPECIES: MBL fold metallo-hydrolase [Thalassotalea]|uniref:MBL fold metallo-hydrolase n=1 Tax=Thalassotalea castellviae TaxID=3075612 RepID=A0ABU3A0H3_9GAMM|nr:MBL fold metallo-hydrolase [Thalassotalea sp. W431]MDT0603683.1 MBL fold metallo-hydrolase [Thalassotalea sp. W431]